MPNPNEDLETEAVEFVPIGRDGRPLSAFDLRVYARAGLTPTEAQHWAQAGIAPYQAEGFADAGADLATAELWAGRGVNGNLYATWHRDGLDPEVAYSDLKRRADEERARQEKDAEESRRRVDERRLNRDELRKQLAGDLLISVGEIADLAGKSGPSVVSNWRSRANDFPAPVLTAPNPRFRASEILEWLRMSKKLPTERADAETPAPIWFWYRAVLALPAETPEPERPLLRSFLAWIVTLAAVLDDQIPYKSVVVAPNTALPETLDAARRLSRDVAEDNPELAPILLAASGPGASEAGSGEATPSDEAFQQLVRVLRLCALSNDPPSALSLLESGLSLLGNVTRPTDATEAGLGDLMTDLLTLQPGDDVLDPACGEAELLFQVARQVGSVTGIDTDAQALRVARARFELAGRTVELHTRDAFEDGEAGESRYGVVTIDPPLDPPSPGAAEWVDLALRSLTPDGRAVVLVPTAAFAPGGPLAPVVRRGSVGAVVLLPKSVRSGTREPLALCVLAGDERYEDLLLVDLTGHTLEGTNPQPTLTRSSLSPKPVSSQGSTLLGRVRHWLDHPTTSPPRWPPTLEGGCEIVTRSDAATKGAIRPIPSKRLERFDPKVTRTARELQQLLAQLPEDPQQAALDEALRQFLDSAQ